MLPVQTSNAGVIVGTARNQPYKIGRNAIAIGSSVDCDYIPFYSIFQSEFYSIGNYKYNIYGLFINHVYTTTTNTSRFISALQYYMMPVIYKKYEGIEYYVMKGIIYYINDVGKPIILMCLVVDNSYWRTADMDNIDFTKFRLIVNNEFNSVKHTSLYAYLRKYIFADYITNNIDIIYTIDIHRYIFKNSFLPEEFTTIVQRKEYFENLNKSVIDELIAS